MGNGHEAIALVFFLERNHANNEINNYLLTFLDYFSLKMEHDDVKVKYSSINS